MARHPSNILSAHQRLGVADRSLSRAHRFIRQATWLMPSDGEADLKCEILRSLQSVMDRLLLLDAMICERGGREMGRTSPYVDEYTRR